MAFPTRLSFVTYNLWNIQRWPLRQAALQGFFQRFRPDIFCLQEVRPETQDALEAILPNYKRVDDPFPGWERENTIFWNGNLLEEVEHGAEDIGISSDKYRRMFWARLKVKDSGQRLFVSTAHYTYQEHPDELRTGQSPRLVQAQKTVEVLKQLVHQNEAGFFMGDLNDPVIPTLVLAQAGYKSSFAALELLPPPTWPAFPTARTSTWQAISNQAIDWIVANEHARPIISSVPQYFLEDVTPSDHWPVLAVYELI